MNEIPLIIQRLREPISEDTRKIRRELLIASMIGIVIAYADLVPTKIEALGINLTPANQASFRYVIAGVILYLTVAFLIYVSSEIIAWASLFRTLDLENVLEEAQSQFNRANERLTAAQKQVNSASEPKEGVFPKLTDKEDLLDRISKALQFVDVENEKLAELREQRRSMEGFFYVLKFGGSLGLIKPMSTVRMSFEAIVPLVLSIWAMLSLLIVS
jgi:hypothetical protein